MRMKDTLLKISAGLAFVAMVTVNVLANSLPINNRTTGAISDAYPNLFAPAGPAFSIWGLIYLLLSGYVVYQFTKRAAQNADLLYKINPLFIATSVANIAWIYAWHYDSIGLSVCIMVVLLGLLIRIADTLRAKQFTLIEKVFVWAPFSVYFGWITVATIANISVFLVSVGWNGFGISDFVWTSIILLVGALIGIVRMNKDANVAYGMVLVWAYSWILYKHVSTVGFGGGYPIVIITAGVCVALFLFFIGTLLFKK